MAISTFLDPRFKDRLVMEDSEIFRERVRQWLIEETSELSEIELDPVGHEENEFVAPISHESPPAKRNNESFFDRLEKIADSVPEKSIYSTMS